MIEFIDLTLTVVVSGAIVYQTVIARRQSKIAATQAAISKVQMEMMRDAEARRVELETPRVQLSLLTHSYGTSGPDGAPKIVSFIGISVTNTSRLDVTIVQLGLELAVKEGETRSVRIAGPPPVAEYEGTQLSDANLPRRLRYGEVMKAYYPETFYKGRGRFRARCKDSIGNTYHSGWLEISKSGIVKNGIVLHADPGAGYVSETEALDRLSE